MLFSAASILAGLLLPLLPACTREPVETEPPSAAFRERFSAERRVFASPVPELHELRSGDVVSVLRGDIRSLLIAFLTMSGFSHVGVVLRDGGETFVLDCLPESSPDNSPTGGACVRRHSLGGWLADAPGAPLLQAVVHRPAFPLDEAALGRTLANLEAACVVFDWSMAMDNDGPDCRRLYCSEFAWTVLAPPRRPPYIDDVAGASARRAWRHRDEPGRGGLAFEAAIDLGQRFGFAPSRIPERVIPPAFADLSPAFVPTAHVLRRPGHPALALSGRIREQVLFLRALDNEPATVRLDEAMDLAGLAPEDREAVVPVVRAARKHSPAASLDGTALVLDLLLSHARTDRPFEEYDAALAALPPSGL